MTNSVKEFQQKKLNMFFGDPGSKMSIYRGCFSPFTSRRPISPSPNTV